MTAEILLSVIFILLLSKEQKEWSVLLLLMVTVLAILGITRFLRPILDFLTNLAELGHLDTQLLQTLVKAVGMTIVSQIAALICEDAGYGVLAKVLHILTAAVVLWLTIPLYEKLIHLVQEILGAI